ncbi:MULTISPECIES: hypothetical protein [Pseudoalteromonas]|uniref:SnoaL-like domain-containing protein n=1 Tax=Pseudoalteromonas amylolytica TaxID=1859457 RepID=A0A1S1MVK0_9GAMM|nr:MULTISPECIES: hypothetical protein [Pseudoalteromonas]OHU87485.1 hypothetical protein BFC16_08470 [Pseudoalteromonas sp. JW3]OHU90928.1 hypothetical protein BET10_08585 [Pseudoalteromonas amylolytica]
MRFCTALILLLLSSSVLAGGTAKAQINTLFEGYMAKYNHFLEHGVLPNTPELYTDTVMLMSSRSKPSVITLAQMNQQVQVFLSSLKADGVSYVKWGKVSIHQLDDNIALVSNIAERYTKTGTLHNKVGASYYVYLIDGQWKISAFAIHNAKNTLI